MQFTHPWALEIAEARAGRGRSLDESALLLQLDELITQLRAAAPRERRDIRAQLRHVEAELARRFANSARAPLGWGLGLIEGEAAER